MIAKPKIHKFLSVPKAAKILGISQPTLKKLLHEKKIPFFKYDRIIRLAQDDVEKFLDESRIEKPTINFSRDN